MGVINGVFFLPDGVIANCQWHGVRLSDLVKHEGTLHKKMVWRSYQPRQGM